MQAWATAAPSGRAQCWWASTSTNGGPWLPPCPAWDPAWAAWSCPCWPPSWCCTTGSGAPSCCTGGWPCTCVSPPLSTARSLTMPVLPETPTSPLHPPRGQVTASRPSSTDPAPRLAGISLLKKAASPALVLTVTSSALWTSLGRLALKRYLGKWCRSLLQNMNRTRWLSQLSLTLTTSRIPCFKNCVTLRRTEQWCHTPGRCHATLLAMWPAADCYLCHRSQRLVCISAHKTIFLAMSAQTATTWSNTSRSEICRTLPATWTRRAKAPDCLMWCSVSKPLPCTQANRTCPLCRLLPLK